MPEDEVTALAVPVHVCAENVVDLANLIREGCKQVGLQVSDSDVLLASSIVVGGQPVSVGSR